MRRLPENVVQLVAIWGCCVGFMLHAGALRAATYPHSISVDQMHFSWSVAGDQLAVQVSAPTRGWVGVGFNPTDMMKGARIVIGYVKDGKPEISNDFGVGVTRHQPVEQLGGKASVTVVGGSETETTTTLEFRLPLKSTGTHGQSIDPAGETTLMLAYGPSDSFLMQHQYEREVKVNLTTGKMQE